MTRREETKRIYCAANVKRRLGTHRVCCIPRTRRTFFSSNPAGNPIYDHPRFRSTSARDIRFERFPRVTFVVQLYTHTRRKLIARGRRIILRYNMVRRKIMTFSAFGTRRLADTIYYPKFLIYDRAITLFCLGISTSYPPSIERNFLE